ncbi:MAG: ZIP family metal transporter [Planctomycetaceae bacterium]
MQPVHLVVVYCVFIAAASLAGGKLPALVRLTHARMQVLVSFVAGLMLGVGLFHLLPHAALETKSLDKAALWTMVGLLGTFFLIRAFHFHQHASAEERGDHANLHAHEHDHDHGHEHDCGAPDPDESVTAHPLSWLGIGLGLSVHTLIDGAALAASVEAESHGGEGLWLAGIGTFLAVFLHKPLDSMSITSLMAAGGWSPAARQAVNCLYALMCPLGALLFWLGVRQTGEAQAMIVGCALAFAAGVFLCISLADLLPELQFHRHDRLTLSAALLFGVVLAWFIRYLEPAHTHALAPQPGHAQPHTH